MFSVYAFGSFLRSPAPRDVDLLITYDEQKISIPEALQFRVRVAEHVTALTGLPADVCLLSIEEDRQTNFSQMAAARLIYEDVQHDSRKIGDIRDRYAHDQHRKQPADDHEMLSKLHKCRLWPDNKSTLSGLDADQVFRCVVGQLSECLKESTARLAATKPPCSGYCPLESFPVDFQ
jgi:hypothetical protein